MADAVVKLKIEAANELFRNRRSAIEYLCACASPTVDSLAIPGSFADEVSAAYALEANGRPKPCLYFPRRTEPLSTDHE